MTFPQVNPGGWALNELLTSAQMNLMQSFIVNAVDGVDGGTYALQSDLRFEGPADFQVNTTLDILGSGKIDMAASSSLNFIAGASLLMFSSSTMILAGLMQVDSGGEIEVESGGALNVEGGAALNVESGGELNVLSGGAAKVLSGGAIDVESGADINVESGGDINVLSGGLLDVEGGAISSIFSGGLLVVVGELRLVNGVDVNISDVDDFTVNSQSITRQWDGVPLLRTIGTGAWDFLSTAGVYRQSDTAASGTFILPVNVNAGDEITQIRVRLDGGAGAGHGASLPGTLPNIRLRRRDPETGVATTISGPTTDTSASAAAYDVPHDVTLSGLTEVSTGQPYFVTIEGETGANSVDDTLQICGVETTVEINSMRATEEVY